jgi:8-oxo-dGTP pyrophosphatase MutT (NUDIX family)/phosphohistidine phosphatase SixA
VADTIRAAGGVLWRPASDGIEVCVVHRPALDDWSLPKGKLQGSEHSLAAAVREVMEETGVRGRPQLRLPEVSYELPDGRPKTVDFWLMRASGDPALDVMDVTEVDTVTWLSLAQAVSRLSYPADAALVDHTAGLPPVTAVTPLVRHAHAGERKKWSGDDALRPIDPDGQIEADGLGVVLALFEPARLFAATPLRCKQTLEPLAERLGLPIVMDSAFAEPADPDELPAKVKVAAARLADLRDGGTVAICSQGKVIPPLLASLRGEEDPAPFKTPKGKGWLLSWSGDSLSALSRL